MIGSNKSIHSICWQDLCPLSRVSFMKDTTADRYSESHLERPLPWQTTCLGGTHIPSRRSNISIYNWTCHQRPGGLSWWALLYWYLFFHNAFDNFSAALNDVTDAHIHQCRHYSYISINGNIILKSTAAQSLSLSTVLNIMPYIFYKIYI